MARKLTLGRIRDLVLQAPRLAFYRLFFWLYRPTILRYKAAATPYPLVRKLLLRLSGVRIGSQTDLGFGVVLVGRAKQTCPLTIGDRAAIGPYACFITSSFPADSQLTNHPELQTAIKRLRPIVVEADAWIGAGAKIMPGVTVGRGAVVGAGAVVVRDVEPWTVVAGVPARVQRRLSDPNDATETQEPS